MFYGRFSGMRERKPGGVLNILLRACRCARVWTVQKWAGKVKIPAGWSEKYLWKDGILYRMTRKKSENTPREKEKMFVRTENSFRKMWIFPLKSPGKSTKMMKTGRKISQFPTKKTWKISGLSGKTCPKLGNGKRKKRIFLLKKFRRSIKIRGRNGKFLSLPTKKTWKISGLSGKTCLKTDDRNKIKQILLLKKFQESKKIMETDRKFSQLHIKKAGKIIPTKRKNLRKRMIRMKKSSRFFRRRTEKCRKGYETGQKNLP